MTITLENVDNATLEAIKSAIKLNPRVRCKVQDFSPKIQKPSIKEAIDETIADFQKPKNYAVFERLKDK